MSTAELPIAPLGLGRAALPRIVGSPVERIDAVEKVTGRAVYAADSRLPRMLHGAVVRSPHACARIISIDTSRAERLPGVHTVVTGADTARVKWGAFRPDLYPLAIGRVRYVGDEVAAVAARDPETARRAAELIHVEYEVLPAVLSLDEALAEGAPLVHDDAPGNVAHEFGFDRGGVEAWFDRSDVVVEGTWQSERQWHGSIETIGCTAEWTRDRVSLWVNTQTPFLARQRYATALGLPLRAVRVVQTEVGGGFGGKSGDDNTSVICALLARRAGRPVQLVNTREEEFLASRPRIPMRYTVRLGFTEDGLVTAKDIEVVADNGAYTGKAQAVLGAATVRHDALFNYRAVRAHSRLIYTNLEPTGAFRGFGNPSADWAVGQAWDLAAARLGIDVPDLFLLNAVESGSVSPHNHKITSCELKQCIRRAAQAIGWQAKRAERTPHRGLAMGVSVHVSGRRSFGDYDGSSAIVRLTEDGRATVIVGEGEIGTGARTTLAQIAAAELGIPVADVSVPRPDTDLTTHALGALASRVTYVAGNAVQRAAQQACERLLDAAARQLDRPAAQLWVEDGTVHGPAGPDGEGPVSAPVGAVVRAELYRPGGEPIVGLGSFDNPSEFPDGSRYGNESGAYNFVAEAAEVEVDPATGAVRVLELAAVADCGTVLNPPLAEGQVEGAIAQGLGMALTERFHWQEGAPVRPNFSDYKLPTAGVMPKLHIGFADSYEPTGPFGAKGVGEIALDPVPSIIASAVADAVGVRVHELPITAEKIYWGMRNGEPGAAVPVTSAPAVPAVQDPSPPAGADRAGQEGDPR
ncbi:dehydrogenase [Streptomyces sulfonofaciens]|uniref:Dehydrogenase n=1 Tax=Streptomyces sulfonofaciens TaxID=68272 RepID=A0A919G3R4_9ACTN|nr:xanthine dehydrogenase family protein molybdopterin-binding subunit [Streptomyces sulfonofaciens]GHH77159.1 dehydrogenase [Streptomyces sulfonofaciens]